VREEIANPGAHPQWRAAVARAAELKRSAFHSAFSSDHFQDDRLIV